MLFSPTKLLFNFFVHLFLRNIQSWFLWTSTLRLVGQSSFGHSAICSLLSFALSGDRTLFSLEHNFPFWISSFCTVVSTRQSPLSPDMIWKKWGDKRSDWLHLWFTRRSIASLSRDLMRSGAVQPFLSYFHFPQWKPLLASLAFAFHNNKHLFLMFIFTTFLFVTFWISVYGSEYMHKTLTQRNQAIDSIDWGLEV